MTRRDGALIADTALDRVDPEDFDLYQKAWLSGFRSALKVLQTPSPGMLNAGLYRGTVEGIWCGMIEQAIKEFGE